MLLPAAFFVAAVFAAIQMEIAIGKNLDSSLRQVFFLQPTSSHSANAEAWFRTAVACFIFGFVTTWRAFKRIKHAPHA